MKITELKLNDINPREIKTKNFEKLKKSIKEFSKMMELRPIVINKENIILGGNMRYLAIKQLGYKEIPKKWLKKADKLTKEEEKRFMIEDNIQFGSWDFDILANEWNSLDLENWGLELEDLHISNEIEKKQINEKYDQVHFLISVPLNLVVKIDEFIKKIEKIPGVEIEKSAN